VCAEKAAERTPTLCRACNAERGHLRYYFMPNLSPELIALGFIWYVAFLFSTTCHEAAHALAAKIGGDDTAFAGGQVSLNPVPHIQREPWGMVVIPILSLVVNGSLIGWASAPYNPDWERRHPRRAAWMALAGPATNYSLMLIAAIALRLGWARHWLREDPLTGNPDFASSALWAFFSLNLLLGTFNLVPVPPLDGSTAIMLFMGETRSRRYLDWLRGNSYRMVGLLLAVVTFPYIYRPIRALATYYLLPSRF
jgi:Zn-dependent protease